MKAQNQNLLSNADRPLRPYYVSELAEAETQWDGERARMGYDEGLAANPCKVTVDSGRNSKRTIEQRLLS